MFIVKIESDTEEDRFFLHRTREACDKRMRKMGFTVPYKENLYLSSDKSLAWAQIYEISASPK